jgi:hypothetical protein
MIKKKVIYTLIIESLLSRHNLKANSNEIFLYLEKQINKMPDYMKFVVAVLFASFYFVVNLMTVKKFNDLDLEKRTEIIFSFRKLPLFKTFFRLIETIVLLKALEEEQ